MHLNSSNLSHPRIQWEIEAALLRAVEMSRPRGIGVAVARNSAGEAIFGVLHDRSEYPAFSFWRQGANVTDQVVAALRAMQ